MPDKKPKVLIIDDNRDVLIAARLLLKSRASEIVTDSNPANIPSLLSTEKFDVIFLDMNFTRDRTSGEEGFSWLAKILEIDSTAVVILITAFGDIDTAVKAVKAGAADFVLKPWQNEKFIATFSAAAKLSASRTELERVRNKQKQLSEDIDKNFSDIIGTSEPIKNLFRMMKKVAATDANVLILGENGTGKELAARALHRESKRKDDIFVSVDLGAIPRTLFESELFGHVRGAFTDAREDRAGRFEVASGGTLFLDEIGNLPVELQAKLLSVIQNKSVARVGSNISKSFDVRLICATNMPIYDMVRNGKFRQDLLYRINTVELKIPPLRERVGDVELLSRHFLNLFRRKYWKPELTISAAALRKLEMYNWPGNVRELQHAIERAVILCDSEELTESDFPISGEKPVNPADSAGTLNLEQIEREAVRTALEKHAGNISKAARELGLTRASLYRRMSKFGLVTGK